MQIGSVLIFPSRSTFTRMQGINAKLELFKYEKGEPRSCQEMKRIILRSVGLQYLIKTYFGKGEFDWRTPYAIFNDCMKLLDEFPLPAPFYDLLVVKYHSVIGRMIIEVPVDRLEDLYASASDPNEVLEAKREALIQFMAQKVFGLTAGRAPSYRETFKPENLRPGHMSAIPDTEFMREIMHPMRDILRTHLTYCEPIIQKALQEYILDPNLPFDIKLPF